MPDFEESKRTFIGFSAKKGEKEVIEEVAKNKSVSVSQLVREALWNAYEKDFLEAKVSKTRKYDFSKI